jgi:transposase
VDNDSSAQKMKVPEISRLYHISKEHIRKIIRRFNEEGMASLKPNFGGGRPRTFTEKQRADIVELAQIPLKVLGLSFTSWSLAKIKEVAEQKKLVKSISVETIRVILEEANITYQHTKTWKESNDPDFAAKKTNPATL